MPGPRLEQRGTNPQPIVVSRDDNIPQLIASTVSTGLKMADTYIQKEQIKDDEQALVDLYETFNQIDTKANQDSAFSSTWADTQKTNALIMASKKNSSVLKPGMNMLGQGTTAGTQLKAKEAGEAADAAKTEDAWNAALVRFNVDPEDIMAEEKVKRARHLQYEADAADDDLRATTAKGGSTKIAWKNKAHTDISNKGSDYVNRWTKAIGVTPKAFDALSDDEKATLAVQIETQLKDLKIKMGKEYGGHIESTEIDTMMAPYVERAQIFQELLGGKYTYDVISQQNNLIDALATQMQSPNPEAKVLWNMAKEAANSRNYDAFMKLVVSGPQAAAVKEALGANYERVIAAALGDNRDQGKSTVDAIETKRGRTAFSKLVYDSLTTSDLDLENQSAKNLANSITSVSGAQARSPASFGVDAWTGMVDFTISRTGKKALKESEDFSEAKELINEGLGWYSVQVGKSAVSNLPSDAVVFINKSGKVDIKLGGDYDEYNRAATWAAWNRDIENWRQTHGARINKLAQAEAIVTDDDADALLRAYVLKMGLVPSTDIDSSDIEQEEVERATRDLDAHYSTAGNL